MNWESYEVICKDFEGLNLFKMIAEKMRKIEQNLRIIVKTIIYQQKDTSLLVEY